MVVPEFQDALTLAFPEATWGAIVRGLREGVGLADDVVKNTPMLNTPVGRDLRGHLRRVGVLYRFQQLCRIGDLPFKAQESECQSAYGIGWTSDLASFSRTWFVQECTGAMPSEFGEQTGSVRKKPIRFADRWPSAFNFRDLATVTEFYSFLTFGTDAAGILTHVSMGMPSSDNTGWLAYANLLRQRDAGREVPSPAPKSPIQRIGCGFWTI